MSATAESFYGGEGKAHRGLGANPGVPGKEEGRAWLQKLLRSWQFPPPPAAIPWETAVASPTSEGIQGLGFIKSQEMAAF